MFYLPVPELWEIYIFPGSVCWLFCCRKYVDRSWYYINRSQTHECGNRDWGCAIWTEVTQFPEKEYVNGILVAVYYSAHVTCWIVLRPKVLHVVGCVESLRWPLSLPTTSVQRPQVGSYRAASGKDDLYMHILPFSRTVWTICGKLSVLCPIPSVNECRNSPSQEGGWRFCRY